MDKDGRGIGPFRCQGGFHMLLLLTLARLRMMTDPLLPPALSYNAIDAWKKDGGLDGVLKIWDWFIHNLMLLRISYFIDLSEELIDLIYSYIYMVLFHCFASMIQSEVLFVFDAEAAGM